MFRDANKPFLAAPRSRLWLKWSGKDKWTRSDALVFSSEYVPYQRNALSHYHIVYTYKVDDERYVGEFDDFSRLPRFQRGGQITVRFNPKRPGRSYFPEEWTETRFFLGALAFGGLIGLIVIVANLAAR